MHVKRSTSKADRRRLLASASDSDSDPEQLSKYDQPQRSFSNGKKRKSETPERRPAKKNSRKSVNGLNEAYDALVEDDPGQNEAELQLLAIETRRLDFEVTKWKQQQALRCETLQLKSEEIDLKEATTKRQQQTQVMELRARLLKALDEAGKPPAQAKKYLALLEG